MNTANATRESHVKIRKACGECGEYYYVSKNAYSLSTRCPSCQDAQTQLKQAERNEKRKRGRGARPYQEHRAPRVRCKRCGKPAGRYPHYCSTHCYLMDFRVAYCLSEVLGD